MRGMVTSEEERGKDVAEARAGLKPTAKVTNGMKTQRKLKKFLIQQAQKVFFTSQMTWNCLLCKTPTWLCTATSYNFLKCPPRRCSTTTCGKASPSHRTSTTVTNCNQAQES